MVVTVHDLRSKADQLGDALDTYDRFVEGWPYESEGSPVEIEKRLTELNSDTCETVSSPGVALVNGIKELYHEAREAEAAYVQQAREGGQPDWSRIVAETEPIREATRRVHTAGYESDPETGEPDYLLPPALCPGYLVSMNTGSSPIIYEDRVAQYRAIVDWFDRSPDVVYHPGAGHDVSPSEAFAQSRVVYADVDEAAMTDLTRAGYEAVGTDATGYDLEGGADVILFRNAGLLEEAIVAANLRPGGWVIANDHLESAQHVAQVDSLDLIGVVPDTWAGDSPAVDTGDMSTSLARLNPNKRQCKRFREPAEEPKSGIPTTERTPLHLYIFQNDS